jgi:hypothetical protein
VKVLPGKSASAPYTHDPVADGVIALLSAVVDVVLAPMGLEAWPVSTLTVTARPSRVLPDWATVTVRANYSTWVIVKAVRDTVPVATIDVLVRLISQPLVPAEPSKTVAEELERTRNHAAVPVFPAAPEVIELAVAVTILDPAEPDATGVPNAVAAKVRVTRRTWAPMAVLASVGWAPE